jgi:hypothetical protein
MLASLLIEHLKVLDRAEWAGFEQFLSQQLSGEMEMDRDVLAFFQYIQPFYPAFEDPLLRKKTIFNNLFPSAGLSDSKIDRLANRLLALCKQFVIQRAETDKEFRDTLDLLIFYRNKGMHKRYQSQLIKARNRLPSGRDRIYHHQLLLLEDEYLVYKAQYTNRKDDQNLNITIRQLDLFYIVSKLELALLRYHTHLLNASSVEADFIELQFVFQIIEQQPQLLNEPAILAYYYIFQLVGVLKTDADIEITSFQKIVKQHYHEFSFDQIQLFHTFIRSYYTKGYNSGKSENLSIIFELYKDYIKDKTIYYNNVLTSSSFQGIVNTALKLRQFNWVLEFLMSHKNKILGESPGGPVFQFNLANYYFSTGDFEKALSLIDIQIEDPIYRLAIRRLEIKIFYELRNFDLAQYRNEAFKNYLFEHYKKKAISDLTFEIHNNFTDVIKKLLNLNPKDVREVTKFKDKLAAYQNSIVEREWLAALFKN